MGFFSSIGNAISGAVKGVSNAVRAVGRTARKVAPAVLGTVGGLASLVPGVGTLVGGALGMAGQMIGGIGDSGQPTAVGGAPIPPQYVQGIAYQGPWSGGQPLGGPQLGPYNTGQTYAQAQAKQSMSEFMKFGLIGLVAFKLLGRN